MSHRLRDLVRRMGYVALATNSGVPRSTAVGWLRRPGHTTVTLGPQLCGAIRGLAARRRAKDLPERRDHARAEVELHVAFPEGVGSLNARRGPTRTFDTLGDEFSTPSSRVQYRESWCQNGSAVTRTRRPKFRMFALVARETWGASRTGCEVRGSRVDSPSDEGRGKWIEVAALFQRSAGSIAATPGGAPDAAEG